MENKMWLKFQKYWSEFYATLAIAYVLDQHYKITFISFIYTKTYVEDSLELGRYNSKLESLFEAFKSKPSNQPLNNNVGNDLDAMNDGGASYDTMETFKVLEKHCGNL
ncbi:hypothetical protein Syun_020551 [Stephania yunnanensis]|uniref:hAT-like transposase RNase-H fold domain-containing protein n=1 Tax=Stephania yunnanensis TaxID=152371 RepID=A0AAP0NPS2_9MAGN